VSQQKEKAGFPVKYTGSISFYENAVLPEIKPQVCIMQAHNFSYYTMLRQINQ
jgi:hypothetical protein